MDTSIDFNVALDLSSDEEEELMIDENGEVNLNGDLSVALLALQDEDVCDFEELFDLSDDELLEEPAGSVPEPADTIDETQELSYSEDDLLEEPQYSSTRPSSPAATPATPPASPAPAPTMNMDISIEMTEGPQINNEPVQGCDNAV